MRRAGRIIYNGAVVVSLLLCLGTVGVWVRSYWVGDEVTWSDWPADHAFLDEKDIWCSRGGIRFETTHYLSENVRTFNDMRFQQHHNPATTYPAYGSNFSLFFFTRPWSYAALGFEWIPQSVVQRHQFSPEDCVLTSLTLPLYFPTLLFALLPAHYFLRVRRRRRIASRRARGCCVFCGYDLRASAGRCPECGRVSGERRRD